MDEKIGMLVNLAELRNDVIKECIEQVKKTPTTQAHTTFDLGLVQSTIIKCTEQLEKMLKNETSTSE